MMNKHILLFSILFFIVVSESFSQFNKVASLNGTNSYIEIPDTNALDITDNFTIEAWIKPCKITGNSIIIGKQRCPQGTRTNSFSYYLSVNAGKLYYHYMPIAYDDCNYTRNVTGTISISANTWTHVAVTHSSSNGISLYVNGLLDITHTTNLSQVRASTSPLRIGVYQLLNGGLGNFFEGGVDEVRIWDKVRTATEIANDMDNELVGNETNLVAYYDMQVSSGYYVSSKKIGFNIYGYADNIAFINHDATICTNNFNKVSSFANRASLIVYPNPVLETSKVEFNAESGTHVVVIKNIYNQIIKSETYSNANDIRISKEKLDTGNYILVITNIDKGLTYTGNLSVIK